MIVKTDLPVIVNGVLIPDVGEHTLAELEAVIEAGITAMGRMGPALDEIRTRHLWREAGDASFGAYCERRWKFSEQRAGQLISGAQVRDALALDPGITVLPAFEAQTRALKKVPPRQRAKVWKEAVKATTPTRAATTGPSAPEVTAAAGRIVQPNFKGAHPAPVGRSTAPVAATAPQPAATTQAPSAPEAGAVDVVVTLSAKMHAKLLAYARPQGLTDSQAGAKIIGRVLAS